MTNLEDRRIYIIIPETVQVPGLKREPIYSYDITPYYNYDTSPYYTSPIVRNINMESGRLKAQCVHVSRRLEREFVYDGNTYEDLTTIVLTVRNSKELEKIYEELRQFCHGHISETRLATYSDHNIPFYGTNDRVRTAIAIGPTTREEVDHIIGHLELYSEERK